MALKRVTVAAAMFAVLGAARADSASLQKEAVPGCVASAIEFVQNTTQMTLDYSPDSLKFIDKIVNVVHVNKLPPEKSAGILQSFGCYAGEVMVRHLNGKWIYIEEKEAQPRMGKGPFLQLPKGILVNPLGKVQKAAENGMEDSIHKFYLVTEAAVR